VTLPADTHWMLDVYVVGRIVKASAEALVVSRDAVLPQEEGGYELFTVEHGHAKKHEVRVGIENDRESQVLSDDLKAGDAVVITGNYQLEDGVEVKVQEAPEEMRETATTTAPATTQQQGSDK